MRVLLIVALVCLPRIALAQSVSSEGGNIVYTGADGTRRQLTHCGGDVEPTLSPDGETVVFVRVPVFLAFARSDLRTVMQPVPPLGECVHPVHTPLTEAERQRTELMAVGVRDGVERLLAWQSMSSAPGLPGSYESPWFPSEANVVHFTSGWGVHALDLDCLAATLAAADSVSGDGTPRPRPWSSFGSCLRLLTRRSFRR